MIATGNRGAKVHDLNIGVFEGIGGGKHEANILHMRAVFVHRPTLAGSWTNTMRVQRSVLRGTKRLVM